MEKHNKNHNCERRIGSFTGTDQDPPVGSRFTLIVPKGVRVPWTLDEAAAETTQVLELVNVPVEAPECFVEVRSVKPEWNPAVRKIELDVWHANWCPFIDSVDYPEAFGDDPPPAGEPDESNPPVNQSSGDAVAVLAQRLPMARTSDVDVAKIDVVFNPRHEFQGLLDLGVSMEVGQLEPLIVVRLGNGRFRLIDGERRVRAAREHTPPIETLEARVYEGLSETQIRLIQLAGFGHRHNLSHRDWAAALTGDGVADIPSAALARYLGVSDDHVRKHRDYLDLYDSLQRAVDEGRLSLNKALQLVKLELAASAEMEERCIAENWSEKRLTAAVDAILHPPLPGMQPLGGGQLAVGSNSPQPTADGPLSSAPPQAGASAGATGSADEDGHGPTDAHDQVNDRRKARVDEAPITGTKADTARERHEQAKADAMAGDEGTKVVPAAVKMPLLKEIGCAISLSGQLVVGDDGVPRASGGVTLKAGPHVKLISVKGWALPTEFLAIVELARGATAKPSKAKPVKKAKARK